MFTIYVFNNRSVVARYVFHCLLHYTWYYWHISCQEEIESCFLSRQYMIWPPYMWHRYVLPNTYIQTPVFITVNIWVRIWVKIWVNICVKILVKMWIKIWVKIWFKVWVKIWVKVWVNIRVKFWVTITVKMWWFWRSLRLAYRACCMRSLTARCTIFLCFGSRMFA